jgi:hypothetical protein
LSLAGLAKVATAQILITAKRYVEMEGNSITTEAIVMMETIRMVMGVVVNVELSLE